MRHRISMVLCCLLALQNIWSQSQLLDIMPYPSEVKAIDGRFIINESFAVGLNPGSGDKLLEEAAGRFLIRLRERTLIPFKKEAPGTALEGSPMSISVKKKVAPAIGVEETYHISVTGKRIKVECATSVGALRAFETLLQMLVIDSSGYFFPALEIDDRPRFKWRGMMVDPARHFLPIELLKKQVDAMSIVKLNVLHLHLSDDEGFRVESKVFPKLHQLGSNGRFYTQSELRSLVGYASARGILVVPEFDLPGHTRSWFAAYPEFASQPGIYKPGPRFEFADNASQQDLLKAVMSGPTPTIDPTNEKVYTFLDRYSFYFAGKDIYKARFFQYITPFPDSENLSQGAIGEEDKISFAIANGAYFVETNGGGAQDFTTMQTHDPTIGAYRANAESAKFSRVVAHHIFGGPRAKPCQGSGCGGIINRYLCSELAYLPIGYYIL